MTMKVRIEDKDALDALSWKALKAYLDRTGWQHAKELPGKGVIYRRRGPDRRLREIAVPLRRDFADYAARMGDAVGTLARAEDRSELDVYEDLRALGARMESDAAEDGGPLPVLNEATRAMHEKIRKWLAEEGWRIEDIPVLSGSFNIVALHSDGRAINVSQPEDVLDHVALSLGWTHGRVRQLIGEIGDSQLHDLVWNIYRDVSLMGLDIYDVKDSSIDMIFRAHIYFDGLTKDTLMQRVQLVNRAYALAMRMSVRAQEAPGRPAGHALSPEDVRRIMRPIAEAAGPLTVAS